MYDLSRAEYSCVKSGAMNLLSRTLLRTLSRPHVLLSRASFSLELLSRRTVTPHHHQHAGFCESFAAGPSSVTFTISFRKLSRPAFWPSRGFYRTPPFATLYCHGLWRCSKFAFCRVLWRQRAPSLSVSLSLCLSPSLSHSPVSLSLLLEEARLCQVLQDLRLGPASTPQGSLLDAAVNANHSQRTLLLPDPFPSRW